MASHFDVYIGALNLTEYCIELGYEEPTRMFYIMINAPDSIIHELSIENPNYYHTRACFIRVLFGFESFCLFGNFDMGAIRELSEEGFFIYLQKERLDTNGVEQFYSFGGNEGVYPVPLRNALDLTGF